MGNPVNGTGNDMNICAEPVPTTHKEFEQWRKRQAFATDDLARMARLVGSDLRILEGPAGRIKLLQDGAAQLRAGFEAKLAARRKEKLMNLYSVCSPCNWQKPYDGNRQWGDFDKCSRCGQTMDVWTEAGIRNEQARLHYNQSASVKQES